MDDLDALLFLADAYQRAEKLKTSSLSWRVFGDSKKLEALRSGRDISYRRLRHALRWFSVNWPPKLPWPENIVRPSTNEAAA